MKTISLTANSLSVLGQAVKSFDTRKVAVLGGDAVRSINRLDKIGDELMFAAQTKSKDLVESMYEFKTKWDADHVLADGEKYTTEQLEQFQSEINAEFTEEKAKASVELADDKYDLVKSFVEKLGAEVFNDFTQETVVDGVKSRTPVNPRPFIAEMSKAFGIE
jgi:ribosomal protein L14E/L6E/L27E